MAGKQNFAIIGISNFALSVIATLVEKRQSITVFDRDEKRLNLYLSEYSTVDAIVLDSTNKRALEKHGIQSYDGVIVGIGNNEASLATILNLIDLECKKIIVRAKDESQRRILLALGLAENQIIVPDRIAGQITAIRSVFNIDFDVNVQSIDDEFVSSTLEVANPDIFDKTIQEIGLSSNKDFNIIQIRHKGKIILPDDYAELKEGDMILVFAKNTIINMLAKKIQGEE
ncbi:potassium channel family protein [Mycoplasma putrefaciens]|uniref:Potassium uptake protein, TrkA family n=2 Tax=Mycoplasma putrefaciens TaxID=2123 RepID=M9WGI6_9MOLU|nr:TrkA family potassium uptake protein [Mycoplasma putrefaciens]AEM68962.1 TrkA family potassium uptake protein [Mycoplasma putrefaciens KS1]AGJ90555.1 Potassium uptake protein, TrkA family [Mycoplasma putrefaciens Mput9231]SYV96457.1 TrkA family potassium uptake protein [Mycoplasma putrefaciens]